MNLLINHLSVSYKNKKETVKALDGFSCAFGEGLTAILGYSGSGKTTLLNAILGTIPYEGEILLDGVESNSIAINKKNFAYCSQEILLYPRWTIFDNIAFPLRQLGLPREEIVRRVYEMADMFGIRVCLSRKARQISIGQQQRAVLAKAFIKKPKICLLDEALANVDAPLRARLSAAIKEYGCANNIKIIYVTHSLKEALLVADELVVIDKGQCVYQGKPIAAYDSGNPVIESLKKEMEA